MQGIPIGEDRPSLLHRIDPWSDFKAGLHYLRHDRRISSALMQLTLLYSVFAALMVLAINLVQVLGLKSNQFGFLLAAAGVGMVLGAGLLGQWGDRYSRQPLPLLGFLIMGLALAVFTLVHHLAIGLGLSVLLGIGAAMIGVPMQTLIQKQTPESMRGKVFGFQNNLVNIALSVPLAIAGPLTDWLGLRGVLLGMSLLVMVGGGWAWQRGNPMFQDAI
ncbi:MFS transporter [Neosynechococcus sphagnicola]|uniref:MFS transporter n=1 Tax=Neosynechococcus sphagnicola TaxID=1501145 RepID=UPI001EF9EB0D|nr:MFS transporter [Neosynechococcus sphagnicola]